MKLKKKYLCTLDVPITLYKKLQICKQFVLKSIKGKNIQNSFWSISSYLIHKCVYDNDNLNYFVNIHNSKFINLTRIDFSLIKRIKQWLINCGIIECNYNYCNLDNNSYSYGYRLNPQLVDLFSSKSISNQQLIKVTFFIHDSFIVNEYNLKIDTLNKLMNKNDYIYKMIRKSKENVEDEQFKYELYQDRKEMNDYELILAERMKKITVDLNKLMKYQGNDFKKLYWVGRILKADKGAEIKFSHGRLYRNPFFHCLPKDFRDCCLYEKKNYIFEGFDVKNCFATLLLKVIEEKVSNQEYEKYKNVVKSGIYEAIANLTAKYDRNDMKQPFCHWLFSNNQTKKLSLDEKFIIVRNYFQNEFPEIYNFLINYPEIQSKEGKKSRLSVDCQWIENQLVLNTLCKWTEETFNVEVWTLHDAICCKEIDSSKINWSQVKDKWDSLMNLKEQVKQIKINKNSIKTYWQKNKISIQNYAAENLNKTKTQRDIINHIQRVITPLITNDVRELIYNGRLKGENYQFRKYKALENIHSIQNKLTLALEKTQNFYPNDFKDIFCWTLNAYNKYFEIQKN